MLPSTFPDAAGSQRTPAESDTASMGPGEVTAQYIPTSADTPTAARGALPKPRVLLTPKRMSDLCCGGDSGVTSSFGEVAGAGMGGAGISATAGAENRARATAMERGAR